MHQSIVKRLFPDSEAVMLHQNGVELTEPSKGVEVVLLTREREAEPFCAEITSGDLYAEIGLRFEGKHLVDYDGVFFLPHEVGEMLTEAGYFVPGECFA